MGIRYNPALDGLRAIAVLAVIEYHGSWHVLGIDGKLGVDVFFVLSGFLITSILLREIDEGGIRLGAFYLRRARRLYPALLLLVTAMLAIGQLSWGGAATALLYLGDYTRPAGILAPTWSLAVEEHYYLLWPLLLPFLARMERRKAIWLLLAVYAASVVWAQAGLIEWKQSFRFDTRMSGLVLGSLLAFLPVRSLLPVAVLGLATVLIGFGLHENRLFAEAATAAVILLTYQVQVPFLANAVLIYIGRVSYGMYLFHWPVTLLVAQRFDGWHALLLTVAGSLALAALSFHTVEACFRTRRDPDRGRVGLMRAAGVTAGYVRNRWR